MKPILLHKCQPISINPPTFLNSIPDALVFEHYCLCCTSFFFVKLSSRAFHLQRSIPSGYRGCSQHALNNVGPLDWTAGENSCCGRESLPDSSSRIFLCIAQCLSWLSNGCFLIWVSYSWEFLWLTLLFKRLWWHQSIASFCYATFIIYASAFLNLPLIRNATAASSSLTTGKCCTGVQQHGETMTEQVRQYIANVLLNIWQYT